MSDPEFRRIRLQACPHCGYRANRIGALTATTPPPRPGDMSICMGCGEALQFDHKLRLARMSAADIAALPADEAQELRNVQRLVRAAIEADPWIA